MPGLIHRRAQFGRCPARRQFPNPHIAKVDRAAFRFQPKVTLAIIAVLAAGHLLAVDMQTDDSVAADDPVMVPLRRSLAPFFTWETAHAVVPSKGFHCRAMDGEHVTMRRVPLVF